MTVYLVVNTKKAEAVKIAQKAAEILIESGAKVITDEEFHTKSTNKNVKLAKNYTACEICDIIITIGGDGTILRAARKSLPYKKPVLGINVGHLGFLATIEQNELNLLEKIVSGNYTVEKRSILNISTTKGKKNAQTAFNEVVIGKHLISQTIDVKIYCDDTLVSEYRGDGVIIATPTGSTAYSLSAGGPVLDAQIDGIVVTPLCAHSMNSPPMVFSANRNIRVTATSDMQSQIVYSCDGQEELTLNELDEVYVSISDEYMTLVSLSEAEQFDAIDKKLKGR